jgi:hypothetical protein
MTGAILAKIIKPSTIGMTKVKVIGTCFLLAQAIYATDIAVPSPAEMLSESEVVAIGTLSRGQEGWLLTINENVKGSCSQGDKLVLSSPYSEEAFSFDHLALLVSTGEFLFVGNLKQTTKTLEPIFGICSFWPQGTTKELLPERTLVGAVAYAKRHLGVIDQTQSATASSVASSSKSPVKSNTDEIKKLSVERPTPKLAPELTAKASLQTTPSGEAGSSMSWSVIVILIMAASGLLWVLLRRLL